MAERDPRLFIAVAVPAAVVTELRSTRERLESAAAPPLRWVRPEGMHLTVWFLGETPRVEVAGIEAAMREAATVTSAHTLRLGSLGLNSARRPRVLWVEFSAAAELTALAERLQAVLTERGFAAPARSFRPHLTLARVPQRLGLAERAALSRLLSATPPPAPLPLPVAVLALMESRLTPGGVRYESWSHASLAAPAAEARR